MLFPLCHEFIDPLVAVLWTFIAKLGLFYRVVIISTPKGPHKHGPTDDKDIAASSSLKR